MKLKEICKKTEYSLLQGSMDTEVKDIVYDSRKLFEGTMFVCMPGSLTDGHKFIPDAVSSHASVIVVENEESAQQIPDSITVIKVASARNALAIMSAAFFDYPARKLTTIGLTGTKGKTTTSYMIKSILEAADKKVGLIGTLGIMIGDKLTPSRNTTPESYEIHHIFAEMVRQGCEYVVMEVSSQSFKLGRVTGIIFDYGIFTNLSADHIGPLEHSSMEEYIQCKSMLFKQCRKGIVNLDDEHTNEILAGCTCGVESFSIDKDADLKASNIQFINENSKLGVAFDSKGVIEGHIKVNIPGKFSVYNAMTAMLVCNLLGIENERIREGLENTQVKGRVEILPSPEEYNLLIDYAHNETSTRNILETLLEYKPKRLICIYGCGGDRAKQRRYDMGRVTGELADLSVLTSDNPRTESVSDIINDIKKGLAEADGKYIEILDRKEAIAYCIENAKQGDMIVLLGKGHENYQEIDGIKYPFDERKIVAEIQQRK